MKSQSFLIFLLITLFVSPIFCQNIRSIEGTGINDVIIMDLAPNGDRWLGSTTQGVEFYRASDNSWHKYDHITTPQLPTDSITSIIVRNVKGNQYAYIGTTKGLFYFENGNYDTVAVHGNRISGLVMTHSDSLLVMTPQGVYFFSDTNYKVLPVINNVYPFNRFSIAQSGGGNCKGYVAGSLNNGAFYVSDYSLSAHIDTIDTSLNHQKLIDNHVTAIYVDANCHDRFIGTQHGLSICPDSPSLHCRNIDTSTVAGFPQNYITSIARNCNGQIWVGTKDSGIVILAVPPPPALPTVVGSITTANGLTDNRIRSIAFSDSNACSKAWVSIGDSTIAVVDTGGHVIKFVNGIQDIYSQNLDVTVYPQPSSDKVNFVFPISIIADLHLTDISGRELLNTAIKNTNNTIVDVSALPIGMYFYHINTSGLLLKAGKLQVIR